jgi:hypothetical protein
MNDRDLSDYLQGPYGDCVDCGRACEGGLCDECGDQRDAHTDALEAAYLLTRMAKAVLRSDLTKVKEVA